MPRRAYPLVQFNASFYIYPNSIRSGRYPIEAGLSRPDREQRNRWLARAADQASSEFHKVVRATFTSSADGAILGSLLDQHGLLAERFFHRRIRERVTHLFAKNQFDLHEIERLLLLAWGSEFRVYNTSDAVFRIVDHIFEQTLIHAISDTAVYGKLEAWFEKYSESQTCALCGKRFRLIDLPDWIYFGSNGFTRCCFECSIVERPKKAELVDLVPEFIDECGFIPNSDANPINWAFTSRLTENQWERAILAYARMGGIDHVKKKYGSWFKALAETGTLPDGVLTTARGVRCLARDGHVCHSLDEQCIDDWLFTHRLAHEREPLYPAHPELNASGRRRADWKVQDTFIEYFGLVGEPRYDKKLDEKIALAQHCSIDLIALYPSDLARLEGKLGHLLESDSHLTP